MRLFFYGKSFCGFCGGSFDGESSNDSAP